MAAVLCYFNSNRSCAAIAPPPPTLTLATGGIYTLKQITELLRLKGGLDIYVDHNQETRRIYLSRGVYPSETLADGLRTATGLSLRHPKDTWFLGPRDLTLGDTTSLPLLPSSILTRIGRDLRPVAEQAKQKAWDTPFPTTDYLSGRDISFSQLTGKQRKFVIEQADRHQVTGIDSAPIISVRLGTSYLMETVAFSPGTASKSEIIFNQATQVYYDYKNELDKDATLPDD